MNPPVSYSELKERTAKSKFRSRFRLDEAGRDYIAVRGWDMIESQAKEIIRKRLAPAILGNDGRQTPMRGHVVFLAQHATATCCRGCLAKWHSIPAGNELSGTEIEYIVRMILGWLRDQAGDLSAYPHTPDLFSFPPE